MTAGEFTAMLSALTTFAAVTVGPLATVVIVRYQERLKAKLQLDTVLKQTRFSGQYAKAAEAIVGIHSRLDDTIRAFGIYVNPIGAANGPMKQDDLAKLSEAKIDFHTFYKQNRIYLPSSLAMRVEKIDALLFELSNDFAVKVRFGQDQEKVDAEWFRIRERLKAEIHPLLADLESRFRHMLGIEDSVSSN